MRTISWESELANLLKDILAVQDEMLQMLVRKRELLVQSDGVGLAAMGPREEAVIARLQECMNRRQAMLDSAAREGLPADNLRSLSGALSAEEQGELKGPLRTAQGNARLLRHHSMTNWFVTQRTLIHLSQMLEIIATGGRLRPTYGQGDTSQPTGSLMDHAA